MLDIRAKAIPHKSQKYNTVGDYGVSRGVEWYSISREMAEVYQRAIFLHEFVERTWVKKHRVSLKAIDVFDVLFEKEFAGGKHSADDEPGDDKRAPYYEGHQIASGIERMFIAAMGADWEDYDKAMMKLWRPKAK